MSPRMVLALSVLGVLLVSNAIVAYKVNEWTDMAVRAEWNNAIAASTEEKLDTVEKQNEVRNAPIDNIVTDRRLLNGSF